MNWISKSDLAIYSFSIDTEQLLSPVYHLVLELINEDYQNRPFYEWGDKVFYVMEVTGRDNLDEERNDTEDSFLYEIARFIDDYLYSQSSLLDSTPIKMLYRDKGILLAPARQNISSVLISWIKKTGIIRQFFSLIKHEGIKKTENTLVKLMNEQYFGSSVKANEINLLKSTLIMKSYVSGYSEVPIDSQSLWICQSWKISLGVNENTEYSEVKFPDIEDSCFAFGEHLLPLGDIAQFVKKENRQEYYWLMLTKVYGARKKRANIYLEKCTDFISALKCSDFAQLLVHLQYNLYLQKDTHEIPEKYKGFFEEVYYIDEFEEKTEQLLFTGCHMKEQIDNRQTMLGMYRTKKSDTKYNLHAWINVESEGSQKMTTGGSIKDTHIKTVYALKPYLSYYFCSDYFEDLFSSVLSECSIPFLHNFELYTSKNPKDAFIEIDNLIKKNDGTLVYIENKTTLNRNNIEETIVKVSNFHRITVDNNKEINIEYYIIAPYRNETIEQGFGYFVNMEGSSLNNFYVPIAQFKGVKLHCIVEPEYDKLKTIVQNIIK